jgi:VWFA-related protein
MRAGPLLTLSLVGAAAALAAQEPAPATSSQVFRSGTTTIPVYASVSDRSGGFVLDLKKDEFELRDNGKLQTITQFTSDVQPLSMLILVDGSASMMAVLESVISAARSVVTRMVPADRTAIASFADVFQMQQPFTSNREELLAHLDNQFSLRLSGETRLWEALTESVLELSNEPGRRVVLVLTDGKQWTNEQGALGATGKEPTLTHAPPSLINLALDRNVLIYAIAVWTRVDSTEMRPSRDIETLAALTGGGYTEMKESDQMQALAAQIMVELHQQYVLGFTPQLFDGTRHRLEVKVKRPGMIVSARRSYFAPKVEKNP